MESHRLGARSRRKASGSRHLAGCMQVLGLLQVGSILVQCRESVGSALHLHQPASSMMADQQSQPTLCEPIGKAGFCTHMPYQLTRMPNFFMDSNQFEAMERSRQYEFLVNSKCSAHLHVYICELLVPVCLDGEAMRRFEIYPCRSFCRQVKRDCESEILSTNERLLNQGAKELLAGFACEKLPYESNGGNGTLDHGPCHELPEVALPGHSPSSAGSQVRQIASGAPYQQPGNQNAYRPYQSGLDAPNVPPFITDTSRIDASMIPRPTVDLATVRRVNQSAGQPERSLWEQIKSFAQQVAWILIRYSNILSIATVLILLLALNSARLRRFKSSCGTFCGTSQGTRPVNVGHGKSAGIAVSPSSSSRSLMLIGAANGKQQPCHKLVCSNDLNQNQDPSHKLIQALGHSQPTLVNLANQQGSRTFEGSTRYLMMAQQQQRAQDHQQHPNYPMFASHNTLDSHSSSHSNQYDYIQVDPHRSTYRSPAGANNLRLAGAPGETGKAQMFSNILLSSPSHQVLLLDAEPPSRLRASRHTPYATPSPYSGSGELCGRSFSRRRAAASPQLERGLPGTPNSGFGGRAGGRPAGASSGSSSSGSSQSSSAALVSPPGRLLQ